MTKKRMTALMLLLVLTAVFLFVLRPFGRSPFAHLKDGDILSASFFVSPPGETLPLTDPAQLDELAEILRGLVVYRKDDSGRDYAGQLVEVTFTLRDGSTHTAGAYNPFLYLDGVCHRTKYRPCEALNAFGNRLLREQ